MESIMVSQDAYEKLHRLEVLTAQHGEQFKAYENLLAQNTETLKEVKNVLIDNARFNERLNSMNNRQNLEDSRFNKLEVKVQSNENKLVYYSGGITVLVFLVGISISFIK
jgi:predicted nuclease with TOPRIM domain